MNYVLVGKNGRPSMRAVYDKMSVDCIILMRKRYKRTGDIRWFILTGHGENHKWIKHLGLNVNPTFSEEDTIIRWGYSGPIAGNPHIYQKAKSIDNISNKARTRLILADKGIPVPETRLNAPMDSYPFIMRPIRHSQGKNFFVINSASDWFPESMYNIEFYSSPIYPKKEEVRVYVAHGKVLMIKDKNYNPEHGIQGNRTITHDEWRVVPVSEYTRYKTACKISCDAVKAVGAHTGGVDVMINRDHPTMKFCICEINSAPTIKSSEYGVARYAKYFDWLFRNKRKWWDYIHPETGESREHPEFGKSYWFTNEQLAR